MRLAPLVFAVAACTPHGAEPVPKPRPPALPDAAIVAEPRPPGVRLPDGVTPLGYDLRLELDPESARFRGEVAIRVRLAAPTTAIWLHAVGLAIESETWTADGATGTLAPIAATGDEMHGFGFGRALAGDVVLAFRYTGDVGAEQEGLFREQTEAGDWLLYSQSESVFARKTLPCFDEPRWKVPWHVTLVVRANLVALANTAETGRDRLDDGRVAVHFAETPPMPSYLLAVAVGRFTIVDAGTVGKQHVPLRVIVPASDAPAKVALVSVTTQQLVARLETYFGSPLPWPKLDLVTVPHLFGAMENPGLITFDRTYFRDELRDRRGFVFVGGHELAHLWFGDWVTFAWWDDLWLAESFASWMGDKVALEIGASGARHGALMRRAFEADDEVEPRPLRRTIANSHDPESAFDAIAYDKGQAVLAMFEHFVGEATFRTAIRAYLDAHRGGTATSAELVAALAKVSAAEVGAALAAIVAHAGVPVLDLACANGGLVGTARVVPIPACVRVPGKPEICAIVGAKPHVFLASCPAWAIGNAGAIGYYHVAPSLLEPPLRERTEDETIARGDDVVAALARGELAPQAALAELAALAAKDPAGRLGALAIAQALDAFVDDARRARWGAWLGMRFLSALARRTPSDRMVADELFALGVTAPHLPAAQVARLGLKINLRRLANGRSTLADVIAMVMPDLKLVGEVDAPTLALLRRTLAATSGTDRGLVLGQLAHGPAALAGDVVANALADPPQPEAIGVLLERSATRTVAWRALQPHVGELAAKIAPDEVVDLIDATRALCDRSARAEVATAFGPVASLAPDGPHALALALATIDRCVARAASAGTNWP